MKRPSQTDIKQKLLNEPDTLSAYQAFEEEYQLLHELLQARRRAGLTQKSIAQHMKTTPSTVSRLESIQYRNENPPTLKTLKRYAHAVGCVVKMQLIPKA